MAILDCLGVRDGKVATGESDERARFLPQRLNSIELFAGAGGLSIGVARAGFKHLAVVEFNSHACRTLRSNRERGANHVKDWPIIENDVRAISFDQYSGEVDLLAGGPPCQPFSLGGKHRGSLDRRDMFPELVRAVRECQPKSFLIENVKGLLRASFSDYFKYILRQLENPQSVRGESESWTDHSQRLERSYPPCHGYNLTYRCINTADYGSAQKRWRVIILGVRKDLGVFPVIPLPTHSEDALLWNKWVSGKYWDQHQVPKKLRPKPDERTRKRVEKLTSNLFHPPSLPWRTLRDAFIGLPDPEYFPDGARAFLNHVHNPGAKSYPGHTGSALDEPSKALKAGDHGVPGGENMLVRPDGSLRYFTIRESARLQDFDDDFFFPGTTSNVMRQLGNAVPSRIGQVMATSLRKIIQESSRSTD